MKYEFDKVLNRRNSFSLKWDVDKNELPMWVADMDFETAPEIKEEIINKAKSGVFGYNIIPDEWYSAYINWWKNNHDFEIEKDWLIFSTGVIASLSSIVRKLTTPAEKVVIQTPVYNIFFNSALNNGRVVLENKLVYDGEKYSIDFEDLEQKLADPQTSLMVLCNPQNPIGIIWSREELEKIGNLCKKYNVTVVSDEIHCDLTEPNCQYTPFASVSDVCRDISITCIAPTKTFNIAGLQTSAVVIPNKVIRHKVWRGLNTDEVAEPNSFAIISAIAAFEKGRPWLDELRKYIADNRKIVTQFVEKEIPEIKVVKSNVTYLLWLDVSSLGASSDTVQKFIREKTGLYVSSGDEYGGDGDKFLRLNIACPKATLNDGLERLKNGINLFIMK